MDVLKRSYRKASVQDDGVRDPCTPMQPRSNENLYRTRVSRSNLIFMRNDSKADEEGNGQSEAVGKETTDRRVNIAFVCSNVCLESKRRRRNCGIG